MTPATSGSRAHVPTAERALIGVLALQGDFAEHIASLRACGVEGIEAIREFLDEYDQSERAEECVEMVALERWREELLAVEERAAAARPKTPAQLLRDKLNAAIAAEEFEEAVWRRYLLKHREDWRNEKLKRKAWL